MKKKSFYVFFLLLFMLLNVFALSGCGSEECGNGSIDPGEYCDDNNDINDDGCTNICTLPECGDGILNQAQEECDDGNDNDLDECSNECFFNN